MLMDNPQKTKSTTRSHLERYCSSPLISMKQYLISVKVYLQRCNSSQTSLFLQQKKTIDRSTLNTEVSKNRFRKGDFCCVSIYNNEIVSYCWIAIQRAYIGEIDKNIHMKSNEIYMYDAFTKPEFRGNNLFPSILTTILDFGRQKGYQKGLIFTLSSNNSSITAIKKAGFNRFQSVYFLDVNTKTRCRYGKTRNGETSIEDRLVQ